jgi:uncharacterized protein YndB with AHSA1/START domain
MSSTPHPDPDGLTGLRLDLTTTLTASWRSVWEVVTDLPRIGRWSPECIEATWLDGATTPAPGVRFTARNRFPDGVVRDALGVVTEMDPPRRFAWTMLDHEERVGSRWCYELRRGPEDVTTLVRHSFEHGPGFTGLRAGARVDRAVIPVRLAQLTRNMSATLLAMERDAKAEVHR